MKQKWIIVGPSWKPLLWNKEVGWVEEDRLDLADTFSDEEKLVYKLPMYGNWKKYDQHKTSTLPFLYVE